MATIKVERENVKMVAHRGLSGLERENTNAAFVAAGNRTYFGIETDVRKTTDGVYYLFHDDALTRVAGLQQDVAACTWAQLRELTLFDMDDTKGRRDLLIPTLENYISICKKYGKVCVLELKQVYTKEEILQIVEIIRELEYLDQVIFISFFYEDLLLLREILPDQSAQFLTDVLDDTMISKLRSDKLDADIYYLSLTEENIRAAHEAGLQVNCWTVDSPEMAEQLIAWDVDYITTNILE